MPVLNLSCGNCKAIRVFSGEPLKCQVCGWENNSPLPVKTLSPRKASWMWTAEEVNLLVNGLFKWLFWGIVILGGVYALGYWLTPEKQRLAQEYKVAEDKVFVEPKPHGCDFDDAP